MKETRTLSQIEQEIAETKAALENVHGTETEVYARIVGYYRAVKHWNNGKKDEFYQRKMFTLEDSHLNTVKSAENNKKEEKNVITENIPHSFTSNEAVTFELYTRKTCPNCPPVKDFVKNLDMSGINIDVDTPEGLAKAAKNGIFASPTVIFYNAAGIETARCHNVEELEAIFNKTTVTA